MDYNYCCGLFIDQLNAFDVMGLSWILVEFDGVSLNCLLEQYTRIGTILLCSELRLILLLTLFIQHNDVFH